MVNREYRIKISYLTKYEITDIVYGYLMSGLINQFGSVTKQTK